MTPLLIVSKLKTSISSAGRDVIAVNDVSFSVGFGETLAIVGESGCGKSMTALSLMRLLPPGGQIISGAMTLGGTDLVSLDEDEMRKVRGARLGMIFQEPMTSLNPVLTIGEQVAEGLRLHRGISKMEAVAEAVSLLEQVGIPSAAIRSRDYPHHLSGGMRQRVMTAIALACRPELLIADEPTTALDVTIQAQILDLLAELRASREMGMILISHDLGVVAENAQRTAIMYAGRIVESATTAELLSNPLHPYTEGLLRSLPQNAVPGSPLPTIPGQVPDLAQSHPGCGFCDRCSDRTWQCGVEFPPLRDMGNGHLVSCWRNP